MIEPVRIGGLMRCCLATLDDHLLALEVRSKEGDQLTCKYCVSKAGDMIFRGGAWEWNRKEPP